MTKDDTCGTCRFFRDVKIEDDEGDGRTGLCLIKPPHGQVEYADGIHVMRALRPLTISTYTCGEHQPKEPTP